MLPSAVFGCWTKSARIRGWRRWGDGELTEAAVDATVTVLRRFISIANGSAWRPFPRLRPGLCYAEDGLEFCVRVRNELELDVEVISSPEEGWLAFLSVRGRFTCRARSGRGRHRRRQHGDRSGFGGLVDQVYTTPLGAVRVRRSATRGVLTSEKLEGLRSMSTAC